MFFLVYFILGWNTYLKKKKAYMHYVEYGNVADNELELILSALVGKKTVQKFSLALLT